MAGRKLKPRNKNVRIKAEPELHVPEPEMAKTISGQPEPEKRPERMQLIVQRTKVDKFNTICNRIEFTPGVCDICGFDVCGANDLGDYWGMSYEKQMKVKDAVAAHKKRAHSQASQNLLFEDELPEQWLGKAREDAELKKREKFGEG